MLQTASLPYARFLCATKGLHANMWQNLCSTVSHFMKIIFRKNMKNRFELNKPLLLLLGLFLLLLRLLLLLIFLLLLSHMISKSS